jgi:hypothetical protein
MSIPIPPHAGLPVVPALFAVLALPSLAASEQVGAFHSRPRDCYTVAGIPAAIVALATTNGDGNREHPDLPWSQWTIDGVSQVKRGQRVLCQRLELNEPAEQVAVAVHYLDGFTDADGHVAVSQPVRVQVLAAGTVVPLAFAVPAEGTTIEQGVFTTFRAEGVGLRWSYDIIGDAVDGFQDVAAGLNLPGGFFDGVQEFDWRPPTSEPGDFSWTGVTIRAVDAQGASVERTFPLTYHNTVPDAIERSRRFGNPYAAPAFVLWSGIANQIPASRGLLSGCTDADGDRLLVDIVNQPTQGELRVNIDDGSFTYRPTVPGNGSDAFVYRVFDGRAYSEPKSVDLGFCTSPADINRDGTIDAADAQFIIDHFGEGTP